MAENKEEDCFVQPDMKVSNGRVPLLQRALLRTRLFPPKFVVGAYVVAASLISVLFMDATTTGMTFGVLCAIASLGGWKRIFPLFMCHTVVFWIARCSLVLSNHRDLLFGMGDVGLLVASLAFSAASFVFLVASGDKIATLDSADDVQLSHCFYAVLFGIVVYLWPLYVGPYRRLPTPIALSMAGVITDMSLFAFLAMLCEPLVYVRREGER